MLVLAQSSLGGDWLAFGHSVAVHAISLLQRIISSQQHLASAFRDLRRHVFCVEVVCIYIRGAEFMH